MRCPVCTADDTRVIDSRPADQGESIRRRRVCRQCGYRFTTYERVAPTLVRKRDGRREQFDPRKIRAGLERALADRPVSAASIDMLVARAEALTFGAASEVPVEEIGRVILDGLREIDEVGYLRFASVYKEFQGASDFEKEMAALEEPG